MTSSCRHAIVCAVAMMGVFVASSAYAVNAQFELRIPGGSDNVLDVNNPADKVLNIELWATLSNGPLPGNVLGYSVYLKTSATDIVSFNEGSFTNAVAFDAPLVNGTDNTPTTGTFARGVNKYPAIPFSLGATKLATFSVTALNPGTVMYSFLDSPPVRPWSFDFANFSSASESQAAPLTIEVVPEPAVSCMMLCGLVWLARRSRRI